MAVSTPPPPVLGEIEASHRAGRRFEPIAERQLDVDLIALADRLPWAAGGLLISRETPGPRGVADLVATTRLQPSLDRRLSAGISYVQNRTDCLVLAATPVARTLTEMSIAGRLAMSVEQVAKRLRRLASSGHVLPYGTGFRRHPQLRPIGRAYALEAKVSDWRQGLFQAIRYSSWCDAAGVVLLNRPRDLEITRLKFAEFGIGLAVRDQWVVRPRIGRPDPGWRLWLSEQTARAFAAGPRTPQ